MFRFLPKRAVLAWLLDRFGPAPAPPRRHFSKNHSHNAHHRAAAGRGRAAHRRRVRARR